EPRAAPLHRMERKGNGSHQGTVLEANGGWRAQHRVSGWRRLPSRPERHALHDEAGGREDCRPAAGRSPAHSSGKNEDLILFVAPVSSPAVSALGTTPLQARVTGCTPKMHCDFIPAIC